MFTLITLIGKRSRNHNLVLSKVGAVTTNLEAGGIYSRAILATKTEISNLHGKTEISNLHDKTEISNLHDKTEISNLHGKSF